MIDVSDEGVTAEANGWNEGGSSSGMGWDRSMGGLVGALKGRYCGGSLSEKSNK